MYIRSFQPYEDFEAFQALWARCFEERYPVTTRVLEQRIWTRPDWAPGDTLVAEMDGVIVGGVVVGCDPLQVSPEHVMGSILLVMVLPEYRRNGVGRALIAAAEARLRQHGVGLALVTGDPWRFWPGVPDNCLEAVPFFEACGYGDKAEVVDFCGPLESFVREERYIAPLRDQGVTIRSAKFEDSLKLFPLLAKESPSWLRAAVYRFAMGDAEHVLLVECGEELVGCLQTYPPHSRVRGANLVWEGIYGSRLGGFGAVLIAEAWRGKGLGAGMCQEAAWYIKQYGATHCYIDWTSRDLGRLYSKVGTSICRTYTQMRKTLA